MKLTPTPTLGAGDVPYFTDTRANGSPMASFFTERADAEAMLLKIKDREPEAVVSVFSLDTALALVSEPRNELEWGGVFRFQTSARESVKANSYSGKDAHLLRDGRIPLFYDRRLTMPSPTGPAYPFFLKVFPWSLSPLPPRAFESRAFAFLLTSRRLISSIDVVDSMSSIVSSIRRRLTSSSQAEDLERTYAASLADRPDAERQALRAVKVEVTSLDLALDAMAAGLVENTNNIYFLSSEGKIKAAPREP